MTHPTHGSWTPVRKDFVDPASTRCHARNAKGGRHHGFPEGHAYILRGPDGHEYPFGPECAREVLAVPEALDQIPDYTERDAVKRIDADLPAPVRRKPSAAELELARRNAATRYVVLRMEKVAAVPRVQPTVLFPALDELYQRIATGGTLTNAQVQRVLAIERSKATPPKLKSTNLLDVYTAHVKLEWLIAGANRVDQIRFLRSLHDWLARHLVLSAAQIAAAGIVMHPHAFRSAWPSEGGPAELF
ncbi:hypothetical protein [Cupriavidus metallidurans]|uniref:Uncharacterized protein n=1 Tax=Cupriavidus metallidurans (strain ATCC 43123 / DSM 2839 / NBRC 102507 / CH34) TaxID=266264 RepID=Q1LNI0_CUPMC|nr:hypothetical protein [Cupriavidus metallidurans]ABF08296.1 conserved hypothetical protein [Cupriavidus metallidurans CH34]QGS30723.1 hypothetical protein FOB83_18625 [Cupriavidus metallidurans]UBM12301.1 hypothetical protein LAI70_18520 [Cupriavidus metallidurans]